jgi:predicted helicase
VVIGNPPYKEKAKNRGGWVESVSRNSPEPPPLAAWMPPAEWGVGAHAKHLRNLYLYFWRWATWKVFDHDPAANYGIVCFITVAGFLNGPGFERMRDYLRCFLAKKKRQPSATASARAVRSQGLVIP